MEWWNGGMMGLKEENQIDTKTAFGPNVPSFQYSILLPL
jgi:hypothetical protein